MRAKDATACAATGTNSCWARRQQQADAFTYGLWIYTLTHLYTQIKYKCRYVLENYT